MFPIDDPRTTEAEDLAEHLDCSVEEAEARLREAGKPLLLTCDACGEFPGDNPGCCLCRQGAHVAATKGTDEALALLARRRDELAQQDTREMRQALDKAVARYLDASRPAPTEQLRLSPLVW